jgi:hypothetical protein
MVIQMYRNAADATDELPKRFERKFYLTPAKIGLAYGLLRNTCLPDDEYASEQINSLYFDTLGLEQHERSSSGDFYKDKIRIRWYSDGEDLHEMETIFIELKSKQGFASTKQRLELQVPAEDLTLNRLGRGIVHRTMLVDTLAKFGHFPAEMLQPVIKISYWRYRFSEFTTGQRVSLDCNIRSTMIIPGPGNGERELELPGGIIEIKGRTMELPITLRHMRMLDIDWSRFSKYSACIDSHTETPGTVGRLSPSGRIVRL